MVDQRLPTVDGDDGEWGEILNQFLSKEHYDTGVNDADNGGHKTITIRPGTTSAGTAPLKFSSGSLMTTPEAGAIEFLTDRLYFTATTGTVRKTIAAYNDVSGATGDLYYRDSSGNFTRLGIGSTDDVLKVSGGLPVWAAASGGTPGGSSTHVQYNSAGAFAGDAKFTYDASRDGNVLIEAATSSKGALLLKAAASQSVPLQTWQNSSSVPMLSVTSTGALAFSGATSGTVTIQPQNTAGTYTLTLPNSAGNADDALTTNGSGSLSWVPKAYSEFIYNSSGVQAKNRYNNWANLMTAIGSIAGPKRIMFEQNETIPSGSYNLDYVTLSGSGAAVYVYDTTVTMATGVTISSWNHGVITGGLRLYSTSTSPIMTYTTATTLTIDDARIEVAGSGAFFYVNNGGLVLSVRITSGVLRATSGPVFDIASTAYAYLFMGQGEEDVMTSATTITGTGGYAIFATSAAAANGWDYVQTLAPLTKIAMAKGANVMYDPSGTSLVATTVQAALTEIANNGGGLQWSTVTGTSQTAAVNHGYITNNASLVTVTLPTTAAVGDTVAITGQGAGGWRLSQNSGETIYFGTATTTTGTGGYLASTHRRDSVSLVCITANNDWEVYSSIGSITYV